MTLDPRTPVLVGAGQVTCRGEGRMDPLALMEAATLAAVDDAGSDRLLDGVGSIAVVDPVSWPVPDPGAMLAARLILHPRETVRTGIGGNSPQRLANDLFARIAAGQLDVALLAGAEAMDTLMPYVKRGERPGWPEQAPDAAPTRSLGDDRTASSPAEMAAGLIAPILYYPLLEGALRGAAGRSVGEHTQHIARLWERVGAPARSNPFAWNPDVPAAQAIATPSAGNRLVSFPYTKLMNANIQVDQGAALLLCSVQAARDAGVRSDRWVFPWAGAEASDHWFVTERPELHRSPALRLCGEALGVSADDVDLFDLYSCFPSAVQIAAFELGVDPFVRDPSVTGGLTFAGGPGNNYVTHSIATMASRLRESDGAVGLVTAVGWYVTKHALGLYSARPPARPFCVFDVQAQVDALPKRVVAEDGAPGASGTIESYTALYERDGTPGIGVVSALLDDGRRALVKSHDADTLAQLLGADALGRRVQLAAGATFSFP